MVEVYTLPYIPNTKDMQIFEFRSLHEEIIKVYHLVPKGKTFFCGGDS